MLLMGYISRVSICRLASEPSDVEECVEAMIVSPWCLAVVKRRASVPV